VYGGVLHILCCVFLCMVVSNTYYVVFSCVWWCPTHIMLCFIVYGGVQHILCCVFLCMMVYNTYYVVFFLFFPSFSVRYISSFSALFIFDCTFSI
jgi:hypothetical protein